MLTKDGAIAKKTTTACTSTKKKKRKFELAFKIMRKPAAKVLYESGNKSHFSLLKNDEEKLLLSSWGLPAAVLAKYRAKGVTTLFPWQLDCLSNKKVLEGCNLLFSAPTSGGKTLVAEILMIKRVLELRKKAIMILPFVSVAKEIMTNLQELVGGAGVRVEGFMGSYNPQGGFKDVDIAICTIEKANSLINRLLEEGDLAQVGTIVVDEIHLLSDPHRGYLLELLLTKIRYMTTLLPPTVAGSSASADSPIGGESIEMEVDEKSQKLNIQIVGMSATLPNLDVLATWLNAELVTTDFRPVPLVERIKIEDQIYNENLQLVGPVVQESLPVVIQNDKDHVVYLSLETVLGGHSILIFCPSKKMCEQTGEQIAQEFFNVGKLNSQVDSQIGEKLRAQLCGYKIEGLIAQLSQSPAGLDETLKKCVAFGVAFHHAGLTFEERDIVETAFKSGVLRVMVATSTLSAGVNLPARRVLIRTSSFSFNRGVLDVLTYRQMCGRAGRKGVDSAGESLLLCSNTTRADGIKLVQSNLPPVKSALLGGQHGEGSLNSSSSSPIKRAILEVVASGVAKTTGQVYSYYRCTLHASTCAAGSGGSSQDASFLPQVVEDCLKFLEENDFIKLQSYESAGRSDEWIATQLGSACLASSLSPDEGILVYKELQKARKSFVLENELHVIYQVTPIYLAEQWKTIDWPKYLDIWVKLSVDEKNVGELVGVNENLIVRAMLGTISWRSQEQALQLSVSQRFFTALALNDLVNEMPIGQVAEKFGMDKGVIQNLQQAASTFAGMVTVFCKRLGWSNLELLLSQFQERLEFGVQRELCDLVRLPLVSAQRARILYDAGITTAAELAASDPAQIEQILHRAGQFRSVVHGDGVPSSGKNQGLFEGEAARSIVSEARQFLQFHNCGGMTTTTGTVGQSSRHFSVSPVEAETETGTAETSDEKRTTTAPTTRTSQITEQEDFDIFDYCSPNRTPTDSANEIEIERHSVRSRSFQAAQIGKRTIQIKVVDSPDCIPIEGFAVHQLIGVGMRLAEKPKNPKSSPLSLSCHGIGSSVVVAAATAAATTKSPSVSVFQSVENVLENDTKNSIALFDELQGAIWMFHWTNSTQMETEYVKIGLKSKTAQIFRRIVRAGAKIVMLDAKDKFKKLWKFCGDELALALALNISDWDWDKTARATATAILDPKIAEWVLEADDQFASTEELASRHIRSQDKIVRKLKWPSQAKDAFRAGTLMKILKEKLDASNFWQHFEGVEMPFVQSLVLMEINGFGLNSLEMESLHKYLDLKSALLELKAYQIAGRPFNLSSPKEIRQILFHELGLKEPENMSGTGKEVLIKLNHELARVILEWRRVASAVQTVDQILQDLNSDTGRVHGCYSEYTKTGRVVMTEPSLQCVPANFELKLEFSEQEIKSILHSCRVKFGPQVSTLSAKIEQHQQGIGTLATHNCDKNMNISMRNAFIPCSTDYVIMSADYAQLELRILAHLSGDENLLHALNQADVDVFRAVAAQWKKIEEHEVTDQMRQEAKAITYGIIYGMGAKALGDRMEIDQEEAALVISDFKRAYPKIQLFIDATKKLYRETGLVETISGRKRFLANINSNNCAERAQAERQVLNFRIQGSASDLVKTAMNKIYFKLGQIFPETINPVLDWPRKICESQQYASAYASKISTTVCFPILNMHDELLFEVRVSHLAQIVDLIKSCMEGCLQLSVRLPVVVKVGKTWGTLAQFAPKNSVIQ